MADKSASISLHVKLFIDPSKTDEFLQALKPTYDAVTAEPANTFFELYQDANIPGVFKIVENWDLSLDDLINTQQSKEYYKPYFAAVSGMQLKPLEVEFFNRMPGNNWISVKRGSHAD